MRKYLITSPEGGKWQVFDEKRELCASIERETNSFCVMLVPDSARLHAENFLEALELIKGEGSAIYNIVGTRVI